MTHCLTKLTDAEQSELEGMLLRLAIFLNEHKAKINMAGSDWDMRGFIYTEDGKALTIDFTKSKPTNGDCWRSMTDEQIAEIIQRDGCCCCPVDDRICEEETQKKLCLEEEEFNELCKTAIIKWLKQEHKPKEEGEAQCSNATSAEAK